MKILKIIDTYFFGSAEDQEGYNQFDKLWFYGTITFGTVVVTILAKSVGF